MTKFLLASAFLALGLPAMNAAITEASELSGTYLLNGTILGGYTEQGQVGQPVTVEASGNNVYINGLFPAITDDELIGSFDAETSTILIKDDYYVGDYDGEDTYSYFYGSDFLDDITLTVTEDGEILFPENTIICAVVYNDETVETWVYGYKNISLVPATEDDAAVDELASDINQTPVYYNLQGVRVNEPAKGSVVIRKQGNKSTKVIIK